MARPDQEAIETFISITGVPESAAIQKLEENHGNLNAAVNAHFTEGDRNIASEAASVASQDDVMDVDDPIPVFPRDLDPFSLPASHSPFVSHPREVREVPVEFRDGIGASGQSGNAPINEDVTENAHNLGPEIRGTIVIDDDDDDSVHPGPSAPTIVDHVPDYSNEIEEEMIRAAIEASKHDTAMPNQDDRLDTGDPNPQPVRSHLGDPELARAVSLSLQTAEKEKALRELEEEKVVDSELEAQQPALPREMGKSTSSNERQSQLEIGSSSIQDEADDVEELELARHRRRRVTSSSIDTPNDIGGVDVNPPSPHPIENVHPAPHSGSDFPSDEWGGISSVEHDEAVMLEAAMFGGIPEGSSYHFPYTPRELMQNGLDRTVGSYPTSMPRPPSPSLTAQRLIREQQDDEYLASLQADREKELKAKEEAEAALAEERRKEDEIRRQLLEEQEIGRQLAAKEASLPQEPTPDDENAVTLLVRMPDGNRRGRRFRKSDMLQYLFDFIDVGRGVKPGSYRLVRPYPRRAFGDGESTSTLNELGLTSKQEALYLELI
ncbi:fas-associated factor 2-a [Phtheirospermum japonicum]|uniref:Fas-associated factor 2-a n=1 Tax=Phtheirospermum japonicum TaxID=374723 RepID=A0A830DFY4_9LAMI|nr:fas-associated factor 2-a [Phtheirospermum japonicum]